MAGVMLWLVYQTHQKAQIRILALCLWAVIIALYHALLGEIFGVLETRINIQVWHCVQREDSGRKHRAPVMCVYTVERILTYNYWTSMEADYMCLAD